MMRFVLVSAVLMVARAAIDNSNCRDYYGGFGATVSCEAGFVPTSLCTSGRRDDCAGFYTILKCCAEVGVTKESKACTVMEGSDGDYLTCQDGRVVDSICTSGMYADCGTNVFTRINCCDDHSQNIATSCNWVHGSYGIVVNCADNQVITGACSSGYQDDCKMSGGAYTGIRCCGV